MDKKKQDVEVINLVSTLFLGPEMIGHKIQPSRPQDCFNLGVFPGFNSQDLSGCRSPAKV